MRFLVDSHYAQRRTDLAFWQGPIRDALTRLQWPVQDLLPVKGDGTNVVFRLGGDQFIKVYTPFFGGRERRDMEAAALRLLAPEGIPVPKVLRKGELEPENTDWPWPFVILSRLDGLPLSRAWESLEPLARAVQMQELGNWLQRIHRAGPGGDIALLERHQRPSGFAGFLSRQLASLKAHPDLIGMRLLENVELPETEPWGSLLHGDLEGEHIFFDGQRICGFLDFGDARVGDPVYDFVAPLLDLGGRNLDLTQAFLSGYGAEPDPVRLGTYAVLHEWTEPAQLVRWVSETGASTPEELGRYFLGFAG